MGRFSVPSLVLAILCLITTDFVYKVETQLVICADSDREALIDFKRGLKDPENRLSSWRGNNCCQWRGIVCENSTGAVTAIDLHNPYPFISSADSTSRYGYWNLSGNIRPSLLKLRSLKHLDLSFNTFQSIPIPHFFGSLKNLQYLNLSNAGFSGAIPSNLGNLSNLQYLDVSSGSFTVDNLEWIVGLGYLKHLEMNQVDLSMVGSNWLEILNKLHFLTDLHLSGCSLSGSISSLDHANFTSLSVIAIGGNNFNSKFPDWLVNITSLVSILASNSGLYGRIPLGLSQLSNLRYLDLSLNNGLTASCSQLFRGDWKRIEVLEFGSNELHGKLPASIGNMTFLTHLGLFENNVEGGIPSSIGKLCNLMYLDVSGNNLTGNLPEILQGAENCPRRSLPSLMNLRLSNNRLVGELPDWLGHLENLVELSLDYNLLQGPIPASLGTLPNLERFGLAGNEINGTLPENLGQLDELVTFDVSYNEMEGAVSEAHFRKLSKLKILLLASNSFTLNVSSNWVPPFQVRNLDMGSCYLGPAFPAWLKSQKEVMFLDFSNASISGHLPNWLWGISSNLSLLNVSLNQLQGHLPDPLDVAPYADIDFSFNLFEGPIPLPTVEIELLDLTNNHFSGPIPSKIAESMPNLIFLSLAANRLTGEIPASIGDMSSLVVIDLSNNNLQGIIPSTIGNCSYLKALDLGNNFLTGLIPETLGQLKQLQSLHLNSNRLSGTIPPTFGNLSILETLDLGNNRLSGNIPPWFGDAFMELRILDLGSNSFSGDLPSKLSKLDALQVLVLAENNFNGNIPPSFGGFKAMSQQEKINQYLQYGTYRGRYYEESLVVNMKGQSLKYTKILSLVTCMDLSGNSLNGMIPEEITNLFGLIVLNLSRNHINGQIPQGISKLRQLLSLDLSDNMLSGAIPPSMSSLTFLSSLNLSNNNFSGKIPTGGQWDGLPESSFAGNPSLCGAPLRVRCQDRTSDKEREVEEDEESDNSFIDGWFYLSMGLGFAVGILVPFLIFAVNKPWGDAYFLFVDKIVDKSMCKKGKRAPQGKNLH